MAAQVETTRNMFTQSQCVYGKSMPDMLGFHSPLASPGLIDPEGEPFLHIFVERASFVSEVMKD